MCTTYHAGQNIVWACWMRIAFALSADPAVLRQALEAGARSATGFVDDMVAALSGQLRRERADLARGSHARRFEMVSLSRAGAAGCPPDRPSSRRPALPSRLDSCGDVAQRQPRFRLIRPGHAIKRAQQASRGLSPEAPASLTGFYRRDPGRPNCPCGAGVPAIQPCSLRMRKRALGGRCRLAGLVLIHREAAASRCSSTAVTKLPPAVQWIMPTLASDRGERASRARSGRSARRRPPFWRCGYARGVGDPRALPAWDILAPPLAVAMADQSPVHGGRFLPDRTLTILSLARKGTAVTVLTIGERWAMPAP